MIPIDTARKVFHQKNSITDIGQEASTHRIRRKQTDEQESFAPYLSEPESIAKRYYVEEKRGSRRYFEDYKRMHLAMRATDTTISSKREDLNTIRAMMEIAEARGWNSIKIRGSSEFKREAWIEATSRGLKSQGFIPSDSDRQEADRRRDEREQQTNQVCKVEHSELSTKRKTEHQAENEVQQPTLQNNHYTIQEAQKHLSKDGRLVLAALTEKIDRQMNKLNLEAKTEIKAFVSTKLMQKEKEEGPIVLSKDQKKAATNPAPMQHRKVTTLTPAPQLEPKAPRQTIR